jgi:hypothetical protein
VSEGVRAVTATTLRDLRPFRFALILAGLAGVALGLAGRELASPPAPAGAAPRPDITPRVWVPRAAVPPRALVVAAAEVLRLESIDERAGELRHRLTVFDDGRVEAVVASAGEPAPPVTGRLAPDELNELVRFVVRDQDFLGFDAAAIDRDLRRDYVYDGRINDPSDTFTTRIRLRTADGGREVSWHQLAAAAMLFPEVERLHQLARVERRLRNVLLVQVEGGPERVGALADWLTEQLRPTYPTLDPFTASDLSARVPAPDGSAVRLTFSHGHKFEPTGYFAATVLVAAGGEPTLGQIMGPSDRRPSKARRPTAADTPPPAPRPPNG